MIALEIKLNGKVLAVAGVDKINALHAQVLAMGQLDCPELRFLTISAMGHVRTPSDDGTVQHQWDVTPIGCDNFSVGDTVTIQVVDTDSPTPPSLTKTYNDKQDAEHHPGT